jgi:hypothetical protein
VQAKLILKIGRFSAPKKRASKNHDFDRESPRSHHKNTITKYALFPKPPLKTPAKPRFLLTASPNNFF